MKEAATSSEEIIGCETRAQMDNKDDMDNGHTQFHPKAHNEPGQASAPCSPFKAAKVELGAVGSEGLPSHRSLAVSSSSDYLNPEWATSLSTPPTKQRHLSASSCADCDTCGGSVDSSEECRGQGHSTLGKAAVDSWLDDCFGGESTVGISQSRRARILSDVDGPSLAGNFHAKVKCMKSNEVLKEAGEEMAKNSHTSANHPHWHRFEQDGDWELGEFRPRVSSWPIRPRGRMPQPHQPSPLTGSPKLSQMKDSQETDSVHHFVRSYSITKKGLIKEKRSIRSSKTSLDSTHSETSERSTPVGQTPYNILLLGASGVGKKALIREFMDPDASESPFESLGKVTIYLHY